MNPSINRDKAGREYWNSLWESRPVPSPFDPNQIGLNHCVDRQFGRYFNRAFTALETKGMSLLELGCSGSRWLPYFVKEFGFEVTGIDYTENGARDAKAVLAKATIPGRIMQADLFSPPEELLGSFDVVVSFGLLEHFTDTPKTLAAFSDYLKPGGYLVTIIPNLTGAIGLLKQRLNRANWEIHVPIMRDELAEAHQQIGLTVHSCDYFLGANWYMVHFENRKHTLLYPILKGLRNLVAKVFMVLEDMGFGLRPNRLTSPYILCFAQKTQGTVQ